ncbi:hypothetical protein AB0O76_42855 [Streptomyces sp. NPDC086554]|uniref:hypothetical protein n=1 Tax=Streptomyces sp. NPDC086554 TaxID=3154864 RepID=UPI003413E513
MAHAVPVPLPSALVDHHADDVEPRTPKAKNTEGLGMNSMTSPRPSGLTADSVK